MTRAILVTLFGLVVTAGVALAELRIDQDLIVAARKALPAEIPTNEVARALDTGLWNPNKTAIAVAFKRPRASLIVVFLRQRGGGYLAVDVSAVEGGNFGKLGVVGRAGYDCFETIPVEWLHRDDGMFQVVMRTRAWKSGKRYTVSEPLIIRADGTPLWR